MGINWKKELSQQEVIGVYKTLKMEMGVSMPIINFEPVVHPGGKYTYTKEEALAWYLPEHCEINFFSDGMTLWTAVHEWAHHVTYEMDMDRTSSETCHGGYFQQTFKKCRKVYTKAMGTEDQTQLTKKQIEFAYAGGSY